MSAIVVPLTSEHRVEAATAKVIDCAWTSAYNLSVCSRGVIRAPSTSSAIVRQREQQSSSEPLLETLAGKVADESGVRGGHVHDRKVLRTPSEVLAADSQSSQWSEMTKGPDNSSMEHSTVWTKSSFSIGAGDCVEFASLPDGTVGVRDSKDPHGAVLRFARSEIDAFLRGAEVGEFDRYR
jgi:hypothetical protein